MCSCVRAFWTRQYLHRSTRGGMQACAEGDAKRDAAAAAGPPPPAAAAAGAGVLQPEAFLRTAKESDERQR